MTSSWVLILSALEVPEVTDGEVTGGVTCVATSLYLRVRGADEVDASVGVVVSLVTFGRGGGGVCVLALVVRATDLSSHSVVHSNTSRGNLSSLFPAGPQASRNPCTIWFSPRRTLATDVWGVGSVSTASFQA